jgi:hypothetical protein
MRSRLKPNLNAVLKIEGPELLDIAAFPKITLLEEANAF